MKLPGGVRNVTGAWVSWIVITASLTGALAPTHAQETAKGRIAGTVAALGGTSGLPMANVSLQGTKLGSATDERGRFEIQSVPAGTYTVIVRLVGYEEWVATGVSVEEGGTARLTVELVESPIRVGEVRVTAEQLRRREDIRTSVLDVRPMQAKTLAGVGEDVMRTLQALPGVVSPNDFTSQLAVRGSGPDQNLIVWDDIEIFNPYRLYGMISMFNPETVSDINLITGGYPAKYGDRLSSVLDVRNREGDRSAPLSGSINASITNANIVLQGRMPAGINGSYLVSARRTYYDLILGPIAKKSGLVSGDVAFPNFSDIQTKLVFQPEDHHRILVNTLFSRDGVNLVSGPDRKQPDSVDVFDNTRNEVLGIAWHFMPSGSFMSKLGLSWYRNAGDTQFGGELLDPTLNRQQIESSGDTVGITFFNLTLDSRYVFRKTTVREDLSWLTGNHVVEGGASIDFLAPDLVWHFHPDESYRAILNDRGFAIPDQFILSQRYNRVSAYAQDKIKINEFLAVQPGLRFDYFGIIGKSYFQPRMSLSYFLDPLTTVRAAWGVYRQSPGYEKLFDQHDFFDLSQAATGGLSAEEALHYVVGIDRWLDSDWQMRIESYYKKFDDLIVQDIKQGIVYRSYPVGGADPHSPAGWTTPVATLGDSVTTQPINGATGRSFGIEVMIEKKYAGPDSRISGWFSYALSRADQDRGGIVTPFKYDQRHTVNLVVDYRLNGWLDLGLRWKYGTNFPYTQPLGIRPRIVSATSSSGTQNTIAVDARGNVLFVIDRGGPENKYSGQYPPYHRLDARLTAHADFWQMQWTFYLDVINVYNRVNALMYQYYVNDDLSIGSNTVGMLPILPTLGFSARF